MTITQIDDRHWRSRSHEAILGIDGDVAFVSRKDGGALGTEWFGVLQSYKNVIWGTEATGVIVLPPQDELRDRSNTYWIRVLPERPAWLPRQQQGIAPEFADNY